MEGLAGSQAIRRARVQLPRDADQESALAAAREDSNVAAHLKGATLRRVVHVPNKLLNLVAHIHGIALHDVYHAGQVRTLKTLHKQIVGSSKKARK